MKKLFYSLLSVIALTIPVVAQQSMALTSLTQSNYVNIRAVATIVDNLTILNATTNAATIQFFDTSRAAGTNVQQEYVSWASVRYTNDVVFTNQTGVLVTNTFIGIFTTPTTNSLATNQLRPIITLIVPAASTLNKDVKLQVVKGLTAYSDQDVTCLTTYRKP